MVPWRCSRMACLTTNSMILFGVGGGEGGDGGLRPAAPGGGASAAAAAVAKHFPSGVTYITPEPGPEPTAWP